MSVVWKCVACGLSGLGPPDPQGAKEYVTKVHGPVLFVSDLRTNSDSALREAATHASSAHAALVACHVLPEFIGFRPLFAQLRVFDREQVRLVSDWAMRLLDDQVARVISKDEPRPTLRLESGSPPVALVDLADELSAGLIVVGGSPEGRGDASPVALAEKISRHVSCLVLLSSPESGRTVLSALDFSDPALPAVHAALEESERLDLPLYVLHAVDPDVSIIAAPEMGFVASLGALVSSYVPTFIEARRAEAGHLLEDLSKSLGKGFVLLRDGPTVDAILGAAESVDASLIVVGTHGRAGLRRLAMGSVAEGVTRGTRRSTLVVPLQRGRASG